MTPIRPSLPPLTPATAAGADAARLAAQKAFFQQAMGGASATAQPVRSAAQAPVVQARPIERRPSANAEQPVRILRPGSLLDIRV